MIGCDNSLFSKEIAVQSVTDFDNGSCGNKKNLNKIHHILVYFLQVFFEEAREKAEEKGVWRRSVAHCKQSEDK